MPYIFYPHKTSQDLSIEISIISKYIIKFMIYVKYHFEIFLTIVMN